MSEIFINVYILLMIPLLSILHITLLKSFTLIKVRFFVQFF